MMNTCKLGVIIAIVSCCSVAANAQELRDCTISARISPDKRSYISQQPIRLNVTLANIGSESESVSLVFPYFDGQLVFSAEGEQVVPRDEYSPASAGRGGMSIPRAIEPGRTLEFPIFFQSYYGSLAPGSHTLHYTIDVPCLSQSQGLKMRSSSGTFSILVEPEDREKLRKIITEYSEALDKGDPAALEALLSMDTPLVIPELKKLLDGSNWQRAFQTLSRFQGNDEAEQMALEALHAKLPARQIASLGILSKWKREIPSEDVKALLTSPSRDVRIAALHYVQALNDAKYLSLIAPLVSDPDGTVAAEARRTMELLKKAQS